MQLFETYPAGAVGGSCFITKDYEVGDGRKVISLDIRLDNLPAHGLLCISQEAVRQLNTILGWTADEDGSARLAAAQTRVAELEDANAKLLVALNGVLAAQDLVPAETPDDEPVKKAPAKKVPAKKQAAAK